MSEQILEKHNGKVPRTFEELEKLPGVGHKTASVVMSQGFGYPAMIIEAKNEEEILNKLSDLPFIKNNYLDIDILEVKPYRGF